VAASKPESSFQDDSGFFCHLMRVSLTTQNRAAEDVYPGLPARHTLNAGLTGLLERMLVITSRTVCRRPAKPAADSTRSGLAAMEFAAVLPILMAVLAGTADYCRFASTAMTVANAARCGAGYGCMHPYDTFTQEVFLRDCRQVVVNPYLSGESSVFLT
jgi:hypothetical protein